jgi:hypothetical protein
VWSAFSCYFSSEMIIKFIYTNIADATLWQENDVLKRVSVIILNGKFNDLFFWFSIFFDKPSRVMGPWLTTRHAILSIRHCVLSDTVLWPETIFGEALAKSSRSFNKNSITFIAIKTTSPHMKVSLIPPLVILHATFQKKKMMIIRKGVFEGAKGAFSLPHNGSYFFWI